MKMDALKRDEKRRGKSRLRRSVFFFLYYSKFCNIALRSMQTVRNEHPCMVLLYHRIVDDETKCLDKGPVVHHHVRDFEKEIRFLKKNCAVLDLDEAVRRIAAGKAFDRPTVVITFDDGYLDNYTLGFPILRKYGVPATVYLTTKLIGSLERTWPDRIEWALLHTKKTGLAWKKIFGDKSLHLRNMDEKRTASIRIAAALKEMDDGCRRDALTELFDMLEVRGDEEDGSGDRMMLNWAEVEEMWRGGITFGAHSHTHPILSRMEHESAKQEILLSKELIEENLGCKVRHFAFPNGREQDFTDPLRSYCEEIGFESVATVVHGVNGGRDGNAMRLKRIGAKGPVWEMTGGMLREMLRWYAMNMNEVGE